MAADNIFSDLIPQQNPSAGGENIFADLIPKPNPTESQFRQPYVTDPLRAGYQATMNSVAKPINSAVESGMETASSVIPQRVKDKFSDLGNYLANDDAIASPIYQASKEGITEIGEQLKDLSSYNQDLAHDLPALGENVKLAGNMALIKPAADLTGSVLGRAGEDISATADARTLKKRNDFVQDLISPKATPSVRSDQFSRSTEQGLLRNRVVEPTPQETAVINEVSKLPVGKNKSLLANYNIIADANENEALGLIDKLKESDIDIPKQDVSAALDSSFSQLQKNPFITGDAETTASRVIDGMKDQLKKNDSTASGILQARKDFDTWVKNQKGKGVFDPQRDSPASIAIQNVRQTINDLVESKVPDVGYKASLQRQSNLYRAMDNLEQKGAYEAPNAAARLTQKVAEKIPGKTLAAKALSLTALGGTGYLSPVAAGVGIAGTGAYKLLSSPVAQKALGVTLSKTGQLLRGGAPLSDAETAAVLQKVQQLPAPEKRLALPSPQRPMVDEGAGNLRPMTDDELALHNLPPSEQAKRVQKVPQSISPTEIDQIIAARKSSADWDNQASALSQQGFTTKEIESHLGKRPNAPSVPQDYGSGINSVKFREKSIDDWVSAYKNLSKDGLTHKEILSKIGKRPEAPEYKKGGPVKKPRNLTAEFLGRKYA